MQQSLMENFNACPPQTKAASPCPPSICGWPPVSPTCAPPLSGKQPQHACNRSTLTRCKAYLEVSQSQWSADDGV